MARASPGGVTTGCARCVRPSRRRCRSRSPRRRGRRRRAARHTAARRGSTRSRPAAKAAAWCAPRGLRSPQHSRGRWSSWSRSRRPAARVSISPSRRSRFRLLTPPSRSRKNHSPKQQSDAAATAAPTARGALRRLRTPRPAAASRAAVLTAQPDSCHRSPSVPGAASAPRRRRSRCLQVLEQMPTAPLDSPGFSSVRSRVGAGQRTAGRLAVG